MTVYFLRRSLSLLFVVLANISLRLPLRNAIRQSTIHRKSTASSASLLPAKATEGAGALLLLRAQCCTVAAAVVPLRNTIRQSIIHRRSIAASAPLLPAKATEGAGALLLLRLQCCTVAATVMLLRNATHKSIIHRRSIAASAPLLPAKATEGAGGLPLLRPQYCTVAAAVVSHERFRTITTTTAPVLLYKCHLLKEENNVQIYLVQCSSRFLRPPQPSLRFSFAREGPVRLPRHFQYIDRSSSPIRSLSLLWSPCSLLLLHGFRRCCTERACKPSPTKSCFWGFGRVTRR